MASSSSPGRAQDHIVLVTGASSGIGAAVARKFAEEGARVILCARRRDRLDSLAREWGDRAHVVTLDVRSRTEVEETLGALPAPFREVTVVVNNAGMARGLGPLQEGAIDDWEEMIDTNVKGLLYVTRALLPGMVARDRGHVINIGSVAGSFPYPGGNVYGGTKAFVEMLSLNLRADLLGKNVRVTDVQPGMVETEFSQVRFGGDEKRAAAVYQDFQALSGADIAETVFFCATLPRHVNVNRMEVMPVMQSFSPFAVKRSST